MAGRVLWAAGGMNCLPVTLMGTVQTVVSGTLRNVRTRVKLKVKINDGSAGNIFIGLICM